MVETVRSKSARRVRGGLAASALAAALALACGGTVFGTRAWIARATPELIAALCDPRPPVPGPAAPDGERAPRTEAGEPPSFAPHLRGAGEFPDDPTSWRYWWRLNREPLLELRAVVRGGHVLAGSDTFFLGAGGGGGGPATAGPSGPAAPGTRRPASGGYGGAYRGPGDTIPPGWAGRAGGAARDAERELEALLVELERADTPAAREALLRERVARLLAGPLQPEGARPADAFFRWFGDNPFELATLDPRSTFAADVDTASYALVRRTLREGFLPRKEQVRTEEFVNAFRPDVPPPVTGTFAVRTELAPSRFGAPAADELGAAPERWMLRVALRGREVTRLERRPLALTFVVDTSGSMAGGARLGLVKRSLRLLLLQLDARDSVAIVAFSNTARLVLPPTSAARRTEVDAGIEGLVSGGGTNAEAGLRLGYEVAAAGLSRAALSRVVLLSDGVANIGQTDQARLTEATRRHREAGVYLNTVGVGLANHNDALLERLANQGDGVCRYIDSELEARRALVEEFTGTFETIARDVKLQVEFDPAQVHRYRLLGYENRAVADEDFRDDAVDGGEIGAGHQVVALYELELLRPRPDASLATVRVRWKAPSGVERDPREDPADELEHAVRFADATSWEGSSAGYRRAVLTAQLAEVLRQSVHARGDSFDELAREVERLERELGDPDVTELLAVVSRVGELARAANEPVPEHLRCFDALCRVQVLAAELAADRGVTDAELVAAVERRGAQLEARLRELLLAELAERRLR